eukprot:3484864-Rhodomonas_salina.2
MALLTPRLVLAGVPVPGRRVHQLPDAHHRPPPRGLRVLLHQERVCRRARRCALRRVPPGSSRPSHLSRPSRLRGALCGTDEDERAGEGVRAVSWAVHRVQPRPRHHALHHHRLHSRPRAPRVVFPVVASVAHPLRGGGVCAGGQVQTDCEPLLLVQPMTSGNGATRGGRQQKDHNETDGEPLSSVGICMRSAMPGTNTACDVTRGRGEGGSVGKSDAGCEHALVQRCNQSDGGVLPSRWLVHDGTGRRTRHAMPDTDSMCRAPRPWQSSGPTSCLTCACLPALLHCDVWHSG